MSKRVVTTVLSAEAVAQILAAHTLASREIEITPDTQVQAELLAVFEKDGRGGVGITQYKLDVTVDELKEGWRG